MMNKAWHTLFFAVLAIAASACLSHPPFETDDIEAPAVDKSPQMGASTCIKTGVIELSGICLNADGARLWAVSDDTKLHGGLYSLGFGGESSKQVSFTHDLEGVTMNPATGDLYVCVEREQAVYKCAAPDYSTFTSVLSDLEVGAKDKEKNGLEGISWYKDDKLLVANQASPTVIAVVSLSSRNIEKRIDIKCASYISDICYDPVDDVIWIADSKNTSVYRVDMDGKLLSTYSVAAMLSNACKTEGICVDRAHGCIWIGCDDSNLLYKVDFKF